MLLDENLFEAKGFVGTQKGEKRGPYKKREKKMDYNTIYDTLTDKGYTVYAGRDGLALSKHKEANLQKAIDFLNSLGIEYTIEYRGYPKKYHLNFSLPTSMLSEPAEVLMAEAVGKKLSFREFVEYLESIDNSYHTFNRVSKTENGKKYTGYRYTLTNPLTDEQSAELSQYSNVEFGKAQYRFAPEINYATIILIDRVETVREKQVRNKMVQEDTSAKTFSRNLGKDDVQHFAKKNRFNYDVNQLRIDNVNKTYEFGQFKILSGRESTKNGKEFERLVNILKDKGYTEVKKTTNESVEEQPKKEQKTIKVTAKQLQNMSKVDALKLLSLTNRQERTGQENITIELVEKMNLLEGTSNFSSLDRLPLLVFDVFDPFSNDDDYEKNVCLLDEEQYEELKVDIENFNTDTKSISNDLYYKANQMYGKELTDEEQSQASKLYDESSWLEDFEVSIEPGYYQAAQLYANTYNGEIFDNVSPENASRITNFFTEMKKKYNLTELSVAYRFSNGETGYNVVKDTDDTINEDLGEEQGSEIISASVTSGPTAGIATVLNALIKDEWEAIQGYNDAIVAAELENFHDIAKVLKDIVNEENLHVGQLEQCMKQVSPNADAINQGEQEAETQLNSVDVVSAPTEDPEEGMHY